VVFASTYEAAKYLTLEQKGELFEKLGAYSLEGEDVHSDIPIIEVILKMAAPNMDAAERRHQAAIENGKKGKEKGGGIGAPRKGETKEEYHARYLEWKRSRDGADNPQEPLNKNTNSNTNNNSNIDNKIDKDIDIKNNTNIGIISNSVSTNSISSLSSNLVKATEEGEEPSKAKHRQGFVSPSNGHQNGKDQEEDYQFSNPVDLNSIEPSEPPSWMDCDLNALPPLVDEGWTPPPPELQHNEVVICDRADDEPPVIIGAGTPLDIIEQAAAPTPKKSRYERLNEIIESNVEAAMDCKEQGEDFMPFLRKAKDVYKDLHNCSEEKAREEISWKMTCLKEDRKRRREIAERIGSAPNLFLKK